MKLSNNSYVTEETIAYYNYLIKKTYNIEPQHINEIQTDRQYKLYSGWRSTDISGVARINNILMDNFYLYLEYLRNTKHFISDTGSTLLSSASFYSSSCHVINLNEKQLISSNVDASFDFVSRGEIKISVPEGFDGNRSFVEFIVPTETIAMLSSFISSAGVQITNAELLGAGTKGKPGGLAKKIYETGVERKNALFFYSKYVLSSSTETTNDGKLKIVANKFRDYIIVEYSANDFVEPFYYNEESTGATLDPLVICKCTFVKSGVK
jgi:hypothetical protein